MRNIEIITSHKIEISYELASVLERIFAFFIDMIALFFTISVISMILGYFFGTTAIGENIIYLTIIPLFTFYTLASETLMHGKTLGKKILGIRVIKLNGDRLEWTDYIIRWILRVIDIWFSVGAIAIIFIVSNEKRQRLGDIFANTAVVKIASSNIYKLEDVLSIANWSNYSVTYNQAKIFNEQQMLLIKEALDKYAKFKNDAHLNAILALSNKVASQLEIEVPKDKTLFLKTLLRDYIYLTR